MNPWDTGREAPPCGCATIAIAPIGIINAGDPTQAYQDGFTIAMMNQDDFNRDGAATIADTIASIAGGIAGVLHGASSIRRNSIDTVGEAIASFFKEVENDEKRNFYWVSLRLVEVMNKDREKNR